MFLYVLVSVLLTVSNAHVSFYTQDIYKLASYGANSCEPGLEIITEEDCFKAIEYLGLPLNPTWSGSSSAVPKYCSTRETLSGGSQFGHFNSASSGSGRSDLAPVCLAIIICSPSDSIAISTDCKCASSATTNECVVGKFCWADNTCNDAKNPFFMVYPDHAWLTYPVDAEAETAVGFKEYGDDAPVSSTVNIPVALLKTKCTYPGFGPPGLDDKGLYVCNNQMNKVIGGVINPRWFMALEDLGCYVHKLSAHGLFYSAENPEGVCDCIFPKVMSTAASCVEFTCVASSRVGSACKTCASPLSRSNECASCHDGFRLMYGDCLSTAVKIPVAELKTKCTYPGDGGPGDDDDGKYICNKQMNKVIGHWHRGIRGPSLEKKPLVDLGCYVQKFSAARVFYSAEDPEGVCDCIFPKVMSTAASCVEFTCVVSPVGSACKTCANPLSRNNECASCHHGFVLVNGDCLNAPVSSTVNIPVAQLKTKCTYPGDGGPGYDDTGTYVCNDQMNKVIGGNNAQWWMKPVDLGCYVQKLSADALLYSAENPEGVCDCIFPKVMSTAGTCVEFTCFVFTRVKSACKTCANPLSRNNECASCNDGFVLVNGDCFSVRQTYLEAVPNLEASVGAATDFKAESGMVFANNVYIMYGAVGLFGLAASLYYRGSRKHNPSDYDKLEVCLDEEL